MLPFIATLTLIGGCTPEIAGWTTNLYAPHQIIATAETDQVPESSGVVASRINPDVYWTHNDSGPYAPRIWAFRLNPREASGKIARHLGYAQLTGASILDWEDMAAGPGPYLYILDGGDNPPCKRTNKRIYRITEPTIDPKGNPVELNVMTDSLRFEYPDLSDPTMPADSNKERYDAESLLVHPDTGDVYIITKRDNKNNATTRVYKLPAKTMIWNAPNRHVLTLVADMSSAIHGTITGGDIAPDGNRVVLRDYLNAYEFTLPESETFDAIWHQPFEAISLWGELQGEGICYTASGADLVATSEVLSVGPDTFPVFRVPWDLANLHVSAIGASSATISWDTRRPLDARVNYGHTTDYSHHVSNKETVRAHSVRLTRLASGQTYYYQVQSGRLVYPFTLSATASRVFFSTRTHVLPDFDADQDVDQADVSHFQECYTGSGIEQTDPFCLNARLDDDTDVDLQDFRILQACFSGDRNAPDPSCELQ